MIRKTLEKEAMNATIYITVDSLTYLKKGGRITTAASLLGTALNLKPILTIQGGKLDAYAKCRGMKAAFKKMCQALDAELEERFYDLYKQGRLKAGIASTWMEPEKLAMFRQELKRTLSGYGMYLYAAYHEYWSSYRTGRSGNWPGRCSCGEIKRK